MQMRRVVTLLLALAVLVLPTAFGAQSRVVKEVVLVNYSEDITYIHRGPYAQFVAFLEDMKVVGYPASRAGRTSLKTLVDFSAVQPTFRPNGLAYIESEQRFAIVSRSPMDRMFVFDARGELRSTRSIEYPGGYVPNYVEGLEYIPPDAGAYPDHLALCTGMLAPNGRMTSDILILRRDGTLAHRVPVPSTTPPFAECLAVAFQPPDLLVVSGVDGDWFTVTVIDFDGQIVGPTTRLGIAVEGLVALPSGEVLAVGGGGTIHSLDGNLNPQPQRDRLYGPNLGFTETTLGLAWDSGNDLLVLAAQPIDLTPRALFNVPTTLNAVTELADLGDYFLGSLTFLPSEKLIAMRHGRRLDPPNPRFVPASIQLFHSGGAHFGEIDLTGLDLGDPVGLAWLPNRDQFAVSFRNPEVAGEVHLLDRNGAHVKTIDYRPTITAPVTSLAFFNPLHSTGGQLLISTGPTSLDRVSTIFVGDLDGNVTGQFPATDFPGMMYVMDLATLTSGEYAGAFAAIASSRWGSIRKLVIFRADTP